MTLALKTHGLDLSLGFGLKDLHLKTKTALASKTHGLGLDGQWLDLEDPGP